MKAFLFIVVLVAVGWGAVGHFGPMLRTPVLPTEHGDYRITKVEPYDLVALVMGAKRYPRDVGSAVMPVDLALAWGPMADPAKVARLSVQQRNRFYFWRVDEATLREFTREKIEHHTANVHCVPASEQVYEDLLRIRKGDSVRMRGWLVDIEGPERSWKTSRSRTDTGPGACEIFLVEELTVSAR